AGHEVLLGSRDAARAGEAAEGIHGAVGQRNADACRAAEVVFVTVPYEGQAPALADLAEPLSGKIVVCTVVPLAVDERGPHPVAVREGSAAEQCQALLPQARVVAGFQWVPAPRLRKPDVVVEMDVPLCSDDADAAAVVAELCADVRSLRGFFAGPLRLAGGLEGLTPVLLSLNRRYKAHTGVRFAGLSL
ncbi:MAG: NAD(P)-binding domain-containing protein, partial [Egibacteraceae bacterium]